jgi:uncharacterized protein (TIGR00369 family)
MSQENAEIEAHYRRLERMYHSAPVNEDSKPRLRVESGGASIEMAVRPSSFHGAGALHGSVFFKMLDDAAAFAIYSVETEVFVATASFTTYLLKPVTAGRLVATGTVVSKSRRTYVAEAVLRCGEDQVGRGSGVFLRTSNQLASLPSYAGAPTNLDLVRSISADWQSGDYSSAEWAHPNIEYVIADGPTPGSWTGLAGMADGFRAFASAWEQYRIEPAEYRELDGERVLVLFHPSGRGKTSGLELGQVGTKTAGLFHIREGKVRKLVFYMDGDRALADLGLSEQDAHADS